MRNVIETEALCKVYAGTYAVRDVHLAVPEGSVYGFIGPNGAGKSTTMKLLLGLVHPTSGHVRLLGETMTPQNRLTLLRETGSLIESPACYGHLTARENLRIAAELRGTSAQEIERVLAVVGLQGETRRKVKAFSLGMRQRLGIAQALLGSPRLLILDEPTNGLDPAGIQEMRALIRSLPAQTGATVLISSHLLGELEQIIDRVGVIGKGELLFQDTLSALRAHSRGETLLRTLDAAQAEQVCASRGLHAACDAEGVLRLPPMTDEPLAALVSALCAQGVRVTGVAQQTRTLEEIFLSLTRAKGGEAACKP